MWFIVVYKRSRPRENVVLRHALYALRHNEVEWTTESEITAEETDSEVESDLERQFFD